MSPQVTRVASILFAVLALLGAGAAIGFYLVFGDSRASLFHQLEYTSVQYQQTRNQLGKVTADNEIAQQQLDSSLAEVARLSASVKTLKQRNEDLSRERELIQSKLQSKIEAEQNLRGEIAAMQKQIDDARNAALLASPQPDADQQTDRQKIHDLQAKVARLESRLGYPASSAAQATAADLADVPDNLKAEVLDISPGNAFVILNIGSRQGAVESLQMVLHRGKTQLARIELTDVMDNYSIAQILPETMNGSVRPGDKAARSF